MKKLLLGLVLSFSLPLITMASCSSVIIEDLKITITTNLTTQETINKAVIDYNSATMEGEKIRILNILFEGITIDNFDNFTVNTTTNSITLTALPNFAFGTQPTIKSRVVSVIY